MAIEEILQRIGEWIVGAVQFLLSKSFFYSFSFFAFLSILIQSFMKALAETTPEPYPNYAFKLLLKTALNLGLHITTIDNQLYIISTEYLALKSPYFWQTITYFYKSAVNLFFYYWWYRVFSWIFTNAGQTLGTGLDQSAGKIDVIRKVLPIYIGFFFIMNFIGLIATNQITLNIPAVSFPEKIKYFTEVNFTSTFDFLTKLFPFKGASHFIFFSFGRMLGTFKETYLPTPEIIEDIPTE